MPEHRGIPVEPGLRRAGVLPQRQREPRRRPVPQPVDPLVQPPDVLLLTADLVQPARLPPEITEKQSCIARSPSAGLQIPRSQGAVRFTIDRNHSSHKYTSNIHTYD